VIVPLHRELATGTLASILRQAGTDAEELRTLLD
jgi:predicted RNA binding protein YcfA (HicA-like mRNA interferase family)